MTDRYPDGVPWAPMPYGLAELPAPGAVVAMRVLLHLLAASGRLPALYEAESEAERDRLTLALFQGPDRVCLHLTDQEIADAIGRRRRCTQMGIAALVRGGYLERSREGGRRILSLRLPSEGGGS